VGVGGVGLGVGGMAQTPKSQIPNPQSPIKIKALFLIIFNKKLF